MKNNIFPKTVFLCLIVFFCFTVLLTKAQSHLQTDQIWLTTETEHFVIIAEASLKNQISSLAADCEQAYADLGPLFQWRFLEKPTVLYSDNSDRHNGWANAISHPTLLILASPARNNSFLASACNHRRRTIYHELTHLLQTDARFGIIRRCHSVFGRVFADLMDPLTLVIALLTLPPANAAPTWYLEGTAIWAETQFGNSGRGRNSEVDAVFRTAVDQKRLLPSTHWHLREPDWPYGNTAYLYGMKAIQEAALFPGNHKPSDANLPGLLGDAVARAPIAGCFNSRAINLLNRDFQDITRDALKHEIQFQSDRITVLEQQPLTRLERWSPLNVHVSEPVWTPAGDLWVVAKFEDRRARLVKVDMTSRNFNAFGPRVSQGWTRTSIDPDTGEIYFTRLDGDNGTEWRSFLFRFDPDTGTTRRVHGPERVADLAVTHQGWMALVIRSANSDALQLWKWKDSDRKELQYKYDCASPDSSDDVSNSVISSPVFRNQKSGVKRQESEIRSTTEILAHIRQTKDTTTIFQTEPGVNGIKTFWESTGSEIRDLSWQPARDFTFCTDISGVYNVYIKNNFQELVIPVSHTLGGIYSCEFNWDGSKAALLVWIQVDIFCPLFTRKCLINQIWNNCPNLNPLCNC
ncbi:hypothetical protein K8T06_10515, partial [bacterium]|nr:hypothetical protein [bacterium]